MQKKKKICVQFKARKKINDYNRVWLSISNSHDQPEHFGTIRGAVKKHFRLFKNTFRKNIAPENSPAKFWGLKEFSGFLINEQQLIHGSSAVRLAYLYIYISWKDIIGHLWAFNLMRRGNACSATNKPSSSRVKTWRSHGRPWRLKSVQGH